MAAPRALPGEAWLARAIMQTLGRPGRPGRPSLPPVEDAYSGPALSHRTRGPSILVRRLLRFRLRPAR